MSVSRLVFMCPFKNSMSYKALFREGFLRTDIAWNDRCDHPTTLPGNRGKRLTGKLYEPFERADGGRASRLDLLRLYI